MDEQGITVVRSDYVQEADPIGSIPLPASMSGAITTGFSKMTGKNPEVLIDKLGERLAFERTGIRLYQALIAKVEASGQNHSLPFTLGDLELIRDQELDHMHMLASVIDSMGADPTAQTPSADVASITASGVLQVLTDPRTTITQCLSAILTAELTDGSGWSLLIRLGEDASQDEEILNKYGLAHQHEAEHVSQVQHWLSQMVLEEAATI